MFKKYFSLIELLVVFAVLLVLISLLQPAFNKAILNAHLALCLNHLKSNGMSLRLYSEDHLTFPKGNAGIVSGYGYGTSYYVPRKLAMGITIIYDQEYSSTPEVMYCPLWRHPFNQLRTIDRNGADPWFPPNYMGGWNEDHENRPQGHMGLSYAYRGSLGPSLNEAPNPYAHKQRTAVLADHFVRREVLYGKAYGHPDSYNCLYLDGSAAKFEDPNHYWMESLQPHSDSIGEEAHRCNANTNGRWFLIERIFRDLFEK